MQLPASFTGFSAVNETPAAISRTRVSWRSRWVADRNTGPVALVLSILATELLDRSS